MDWKLKDINKCEICRTLYDKGLGIYEFYMIQNAYPSWIEKDEHYIAHEVICVDQLTQEQIDECLGSYGYEGIEDLQKKHENDWPSLLAQYVFEMHAASTRGKITECMPWKKAKEIIQELSGFYNWEPEIHKMLVLSTAHITAETAELMDQDAVSIPIYQKENYGYFIPVPETETPIDDVPEDLLRCCQFAEANGCDWLCLDSDGPEVCSLESYDW